MACLRRRRTARFVKIILGLGNPDREYALTRHNIAWWVLDHLAAVWSFDGWKRDHDALVASGVVDGIRTRLIKPQTYVNLSGAALRPYVRRPTWSAATDLLVIADDIALPVGTYRVRRAGSSGGHNGLKSIEAALGSREYARLKIGIRPDVEPAGDRWHADYVLGPVGKEERAILTALMPTLTDAVKVWLHEGVDVAMNRFNR